MLENSGFFWIPDLSFPNFELGLSWIADLWSAGEYGRLLAYFVLPVLLIVSQIFMQKWMTPSTGDSEQAKMMQNMSLFMTLFFGYFTLQVPAGLSLYWVTSNLLQILQQWAVTRFFLQKPQVALATRAGDAKAADIPTTDVKKTAEVKLQSSPSVKPRIFTGKNVEEAIAEGLRVLGLNLAEAEIEIISRGSRGIFGLGSEPAQVRIKSRRMNATPPVEATVISVPPSTEEAKQDSLGHQPAATPDAGPVSQSIETSVAAFPPGETESEEKGEPGEAAETLTAEEEERLTQLASELLGNVVRLMGFEARVIAEWHEPDADNDQRYLLLNLHGKDLTPLIGRRGETLNNLQYLVRLMVNQRLHRWKNIVVDVEGYRRRRMEHLAQLALRSAQQVAQTGRALALEPMPASERRIIHLTLRDHPDVITESSGEGERRKVQILPRKQT